MLVAGHIGDMRVADSAACFVGDRKPLRGNALLLPALLRHIWRAS